MAANPGSARNEVLGRLIDPSVCASAFAHSGVSEGLGEVVIKISTNAIAESFECAISVHRAVGASI